MGVLLFDIHKVTGGNPLENPPHLPILQWRCLSQGVGVIKRDPPPPGAVLHIYPLRWTPAFHR